MIKTLRSVVANDSTEGEMNNGSSTRELNFAINSKHVIGRPFFLLSEHSQRSRRNLLIYSFVSSLIWIGDLKVKSLSLGGVQIDGLTSDFVIYTCCFASFYELLMYITRSIDDYYNCRDGLAKKAPAVGLGDSGNMPDKDILSEITKIVSNGGGGNSSLEELVKNYFYKKSFANKFHKARFAIFEILFPVLAFLCGCFPLVREILSFVL